MTTLQDCIIDILRKNGEPIPADDLVAKVKATQPKLRNAQVRAALFPLMSTHQVELSDDRKVKLLDCVATAEA